MRKLPVVLVAVVAMLVVSALPAGAVPPGALEPAFGGDGHVEVNLVDVLPACMAQPTNPQCAPNAEAPSDVIGQPDGSVVVLTMYPLQCCSGPSVVFRVKPDGSFDPTFGTGGVTGIGLPLGQGTQIGDMRTDGQGRIVIQWVPATSYGLPAGNVFYTRLLPNGKLDTTFGYGGSVPLRGLAFAVASDGSVFVVTGTRTTNGVFFATVAKLGPSGRVDTTFGTMGTAILATPALTPDLRVVSDVTNLAVQPDGKIAAVLAAEFQGQGQRLVIGRLTPTGQPDTTLGPGGVEVPLNPPTAPDLFALTTTTLIASPDGGLLVGGGVVGTESNGKIVRLDGSGHPDLAFGTNGAVVIDLIHGAGTFDSLSWIETDAAGRILVADDFGLGFTHRVAIARYTDRGVLDPTYGTGGLSLVPPWALRAGGGSRPAFATTGGGAVVIADNVDDPVRLCPSSVGAIPCTNIALTELAG